MADEYTVSAQMLKSRSGEFDIESIHTLDLSSLDLSSVGCVGECTSLERLDLSNNDLSRLYALASLTNLETLNLSGNRIQSLEGLQALDNLTTLNLAGNLLMSADCLLVLSSLDQLINLRLRDIMKDLANPLCNSVTYRNDVTAVLPKLEILDGEILKGKGSEFFGLLRDLERKVERDTDDNLNVSVPRDRTWVVGALRDSSADDAKLRGDEQELETMLADCRRLSLDLENKISVASSSLKS